MKVKEAQVLHLLNWNKHLPPPGYNHAAALL
jgi:hypothetical protein